MNKTGGEGFTVVELAVVTALILVVAGAVLGVLTSSERAERAVSEQVEATEQLRVVLDQFTADGREGQQVVVARCELLSFRSLQRAGARDVAWSYDRDGRELTRTVDGRTDVVLSGLTDACFTAPDGAALSCVDALTCDSVRAVRLALLTTAPGASQPIALASTVRLRNTATPAP